MAYQGATGVDSVLVKTWRVENTVNAPKWLLELNYGVQASTIPATRLPGLVFDSVVELGGELIDGAVDLSKFTYRELKHVVKGESLETSKAVAIMGKFIGEEAARFVLKEPSESVEIAQKMVANFNILTPEEKFKSLTKLYASFLAIPTAASHIKKTGGEVAGIVTKIGQGHYELVNPVTFQFEAGRLNAGLPIDAIKLQNPLKPKVDAADKYHAYKRAPNSLPGFPDAVKVEINSSRKRWELPRGKILEWDYQHGEIEMYNKRGIHIGVYNPKTGELIKPAVAGRRIKQ